MKWMPCWFSWCRWAYVVSCESPEVDEAQDLVRLLGLGNAGFGIAEHPRGGVPRQEDQNALLTPAAARHVVLFQRLGLGIGGHGVKVEVDGRPASEADPVHGVGPGVHQARGAAAIDAGTVGREVGPFRDDVEAGKEGDARVEHQIHDMALAFFAEQLERQQGPHRLGRRNHFRFRQRGGAHDGGHIEIPHQRHEEEQAPDARAKRARGDTQRAHVGHGRRVRLQPVRPLVIPTTGQPGEALFPQQDRQGVDAGRVAGRRQLPLDIVDGQILLPHRDSEIPHAVTNRRGLRPMFERLEESGALAGIMAKLVTEDPEGAGRVAKAARHDVGGLALDEESAQGLILPLARRIGGEKEASGPRRC